MQLNRFKNGFQEPELSGTQIIKQHTIFFLKESMKPHLKDPVLDLFTICLSNRITVDIQWILRTENREDYATSIR